MARFAQMRTGERRLPARFRTMPSHPLPGSPRVVVVMPTFEQAPHLPRALESLRRQTFLSWHLVVVDDGSRDETPHVLAREAGADARIAVITFPENRGMPDAINVALDASDAPLVAYLPSDDVWHRDHLQSLVGCIDARPEAIAVYSGVRHHYNRTSTGAPPDETLQPVQ